MTNPYEIDPKKLKSSTARVQEEQLITLKDDSTRPPPTFGTPSWMSIIGGPTLGQPASSHTTFDHSKSRFRWSPAFWLVLAVFGVLAYFLISSFLA